MMPTSILAWLGLVAVVASLLVRLLVPAAPAYAYSLMVVGALLLIVAIVLDRRRVGGALGSGRGRFGVGATVRACLFVGIVILVNAIAWTLPCRLDLTGLSQFTLTSQTKEVLGSLDTPVEIVSFFTPGPTAAVESYAESLLTEYQTYGRQITVRNVDPNLSPDIAREYGVEQMGALVGVLVFTGEAGRKRVFGPEVMAGAEHAFTGALLEVTGAKQKLVLFLTGHGEARIGTDYSQANSGLRDNLFQTSELDLLATPTIPPKAAAVVLAGPRQPLSTAEVDILSDYLRAGGHLLVMLNPGNQGGLESLLANWWLEVGEGRIVDPTAHVAPAEDNIEVDRTRNAFRLPQANFPGAAAILPKSGLPESLELTPLAWASSDSVLQVEGQGGRKGSLAVGALISVKPGHATGGGVRLAVIGDSDFASNAHFASGNNGDLFVTTVNWLTEEASVISVDRKALDVRRLVLTPEQARILHAGSISFLPLFLILAAGLAWWRRR